MEIFMETLFLAETDVVVNLHSGLWWPASNYAYSKSGSGFPSHPQAIKIDPEDTSQGVCDHI
jgi:hypothetical protein